MALARSSSTPSVDERSRRNPTYTLPPLPPIAADVAPSNMNNYAYRQDSIHSPYSHSATPYPAHPFNSFPASHFSYSHSPSPHHPSSSYPPPSSSHTATPAPSVPSQSATVPPHKRKRKSTDASTDQDDILSPTDSHHLGSSQSLSASQSQSDLNLKKRTKTQRACDSCRSRKIRCDILPDADPPICQHCKQYTFDCTFFLPITETRFKKKRNDEPQSSVPPPPLPPKSSVSAPRSPPETQASNSHSHQGEVKLIGPTSATYLLHSTATVPPKAYGSFDQKYHHRFSVGRGSSDSVIQVLEQPSPTSFEPGHHVSNLDLRLDSAVFQNLINSYFRSITTIFPVITQEEFLALCQPNNSPPPILLYSVALIAAAQRNVSQADFDALRTTVNSIIKSDDVLSNATLTNLKSLLILSMCSDAHSSHVPQALSALWVRLGAAIRMGQDLGLHRTESMNIDIEMRRRLWAACVISDRWCSLTYGHPYMIDVEDCDARLPSSGWPDDAYMDELVRLSILLGKVLKMIYSPTGLTRATDSGLYDLLSQIDSWNASLPPALTYVGPQSSTHAGLLHLLYSCVCMLFWRVFMRISYTCPAHLKFGLSVERWTGLVKITRESIEWLEVEEMGAGEGSDGSVWDSWVIVPYAVTCCALVQYHTFARRRDREAQNVLKRLRDCVKRWEERIDGGHMSTGRKTAEIITLLYEATLLPGLPTDIAEKTLNPTAGVETKIPASVRGVIFRKDKSRPGGGVFVADKERMNLGDLPRNTVIVVEDVGPEMGSDDGSDNENGGGETNGKREGGAAEIKIEGSSTSSNLNGSVVPGEVPHHLLFPSSRASAGANAGGYDPSSSSSLSHSGPPVNASNPLPAFMPPPSHTTFPTLPNLSLNLNPSLGLPPAPGVLLMNVPEHTSYPQGIDSNVLNNLVSNEMVLDGLPGSMFDWDQWENYFSRFPTLPTENSIGLGDRQTGVVEGGGGPGYPFSSTREGNGNSGKEG